METKANYVIVGAFTVLALIAAFAFVYWTATAGDQGETAPLRIVIPGSAAGLSRGSAVLFNGIKVGDVRSVFFRPEDPNIAIADAEVSIITPITRSTKANIGIAGLSGQANINLVGADPREPNLLLVARANGTRAEIEANPSAVTNLLETAQNIFARADSVLGEVEGFVRDVRGPLAKTFENAQQFSQALADNSDGIDKFLQSVSALSEELAGVSGKLDGTLQAAERILSAVNPDQIETIVANVETFSRSLGETGDELERLMQGVDRALVSVDGLAKGATDTLGRVDQVIAGIDPDTVRKTLLNIEEASDNARKAASDIARITESVGDKGGDIDQIIADVGEMTKRLNEASVRVDGVLAKVDSLLGSGEAEGVMTQASETLKAFREVADTLNARIGPITDGLARFSGQGLRDVEALVRDGRRSITRIEQAITDLERNPQRILTGGDGSVREYDGRARR
ncbi:MAG: MlaD family protein [Rhizobiaceae bacterium]